MGFFPIDVFRGMRVFIARQDRALRFLPKRPLNGTWLAPGKGLRTVALIVATGGVAACGGSEKDVYISADVNTLYNVGMDHLEQRQWTQAVRFFNEVERQHPYSAWARRAQLMGAYAHYKKNDFDEAILASQRYLSLHPGSEQAPYAYYLIGLSYYEQIVDVGRDQRVTEQARDALYEVTQRYPDSEYAKDARAKYALTLDQLAGKEMTVGRFYQNQERLIAALGRFKTVVERYPNTNHVAEALHRMVEIYWALGITEEAQAYAAVLGHNFPDSKWYRYAYDVVKDDYTAPSEGGGFFSWLF